MSSLLTRGPVFQIKLLLASILAVVGLAHAYIDEAISLALEAATPYIEQGFEVREDNWSGEIEAGKTLLVKHQLFRGNEYWFWAATSWPGASIRVDIYDSEGNTVGLESFSDAGYAGVRALPQKTGTYYLRLAPTYTPDPNGLTPAERGANEPVEGVAEFDGTLDWGLVYGYR